MVEFLVSVVPPGGGEEDYQFRMKSLTIPRVGEYLILRGAEGQSAFQVTNVTYWADEKDAFSEVKHATTVAVQAEPVQIDAQSPKHAKLLAVYQSRGLCTKCYPDND